MPLLARKKLLLAKTESSYGVDPTPTGAANAILTSDLSINPLAGPSVSRNFDRAAFGNSLNIKTATFVEISFMVEIAGSGDADTPPAYCRRPETWSARLSRPMRPSRRARSLQYPRSKRYAFHLPPQ